MRERRSTPTDPMASTLDGPLPDEQVRQRAGEAALWLDVMADLSPDRAWRIRNTLTASAAYGRTDG